MAWYRSNEHLLLVVYVCVRACVMIGMVWPGTALNGFNLSVCSNAIAESENNPSRALDYVCQECSRRIGNLARHKCIDEKSKPLCDQVGAQQCTKCDRWSLSRGGLAVHRYIPGAPLVSSSSLMSPTFPSPVTTSPVLPVNSTPSPCCSFHCQVCNRCFRSGPGYRRHNCNRGSHPVDRSEYSQCCLTCPRKFNRSQDLARHQCKLMWVRWAKWTSSSLTGDNIELMCTKATCTHVLCNACLCIFSFSSIWRQKRNLLGIEYGFFVHDFWLWYAYYCSIINILLIIIM